MWHMHDGHFWGMHWFWWILWALVLIWIFATPWSIPGQRNIKGSPHDILKKRFANVEIDVKEYEERKKILDRDAS